MIDLVKAVMILVATLVLFFGIIQLGYEHNVKRVKALEAGSSATCEGLYVIADSCK